jgi:hypothetical protein
MHIKTERIPGCSRSRATKLRVFDSNGRMVEEMKTANGIIGRSKFVWNADDCPSGVYLIKLSADNEVESAKVMLVK